MGGMLATQGGRNTKTSKASGRQRQEEATMGPGRPEMSQLLARALHPFPLHCRSDLLKLGGMLGRRRAGLRFK